MKSTGAYLALALLGVLGLQSGCASYSQSASQTVVPDNQSVAEASATQPPNIVLIVTDDMFPHMFNNLPQGAGKNLTPNLDRLISEGSFLSNTFVSSPVCTPSRYSILTGNFASRANNDEFTHFTAKNDGQTVIQWNSFITPGDKTTVGARLQALGYRTGFVGKNHVVESKAQGAQTRAWNLDGDPTQPAIKAELQRRHAALAADIRSVGFDFADRLYHDNPNWLGMRALAFQNMDWITEGGVNFIKQSQGDDPFFLYFATTLPHAPTQPERSWQADPRITPLGILDEVPQVQPARSTLTPRIREAGLGGTGRENLLWIDDAIGALLGTLEETGELDNTIIVFFNDHGQNEKGTLYNGGIRTQAFVWKSGGFGCGKNCNFTVSNTDFADTIVEFAGGDPDITQTDGSSFADALQTGEREALRSMYFELGYARAVVMDGWKYLALRYPAYADKWTLEERAKVLADYTALRESFGQQGIATDPSLPFGHLEMTPGGGGAENKVYRTKPGIFARDQLYKISEDPRETVNLADDPAYAEKLVEMRAELQRHLDRLPGRFDLSRAQ